MFIFIARHAWAGEHGDPRWSDDSLRELTRDGIERYTRVVHALSGRGFAPEQIATSPYARCRQTADIIAANIVSKPNIVELNALQPGAEIEALLEWSRAQRGMNLCWVGHSPDVEYLTAELIGDTAAHIRFAKGAVAAIDVDANITPGEGQLNWLATAKVLGV